MRFPFSIWMTRQTSPVPDRYLAANPDLYGFTPLQVYDACVAALTSAGLIVIPNCHMLSAGWCCANDDRNGLWYNDDWPAAAFTAAWQDIATRYAANPLVAAMDIKNEPRPARVGWRTLTPTWGAGRRTDFAAMYTATGNLIHRVNPDVLIMCDGLSYASDLTGVAAHPVRLDHPGMVVYGRHDYPWFHPDHQPREAFFGQLKDAAGYIMEDQIAPVWVGEFSTDTRSPGQFRAVGGDPARRGPQRRVVAHHVRLADRRRRGLVLVGPQPNARPGHESGVRAAALRLGSAGHGRAADRGLERRGQPGDHEILQSLMPPRTGPGIS